MKLAQLAQFGFVAIASVGVYSFVRAAQTDHRASSCQALCQLRPSYAARNRTVPDVDLADAQGRPVRLSAVRGNSPIVLSFWTQACAPCLQEMPALAEMARLVDRLGVKVVSVCTDEGGYPTVRDTLATVLGDGEPPFTLLFDPDAEDIAAKFGTTMYPETWIIDAHGTIRVRVDGNPASRGIPWSSPVALEVIENIARPGSCPVDFKQGQPLGPFASLCSER